MSVVALETVLVAVIAVAKGVSPSASGNDTGRRRSVIALASVCHRHPVGYLVDGDKKFTDCWLGLRVATKVDLLVFAEANRHMHGF